MTLRELKTGQSAPKDISDNAAVARGVRMEGAIRNFFAASHPEFKVEYHQFDILFQSERPHFFATLDGEIVNEHGRRGVLEIKTCAPKGNWSEWSNGNMKQAYYVQVLAQLLATGYDFAYLYAALYSMNGDVTLREYEIQRADVEEDLKWLLEKETEFFRHIQNRTLPPVPLTL